MFGLVDLWNWFRDSRNLALLTALASVIGFLWIKFSPADAASIAPASASQTQIEINIDARQPDVQTTSGSMPNTSDALVMAPPAKKKVMTPLAEQHFPIQHQLAYEVPVEVLPGFWISLSGYDGLENNLTADLLSPSWGDRPVSFKVGGAPFDFTHNCCLDA